MAETDSICATGPFLPGPTGEGSTLSAYAPLPPNLDEVKLQIHGNNYVSAHSTTYKSSLEKYFTETTMSWLRGDGMIYRPGLVPEDVWKWDTSGESEYGVIEPPINEPNYDLFDSNWSAQFVVFSRNSIDSLSCKSLDLDWCSYGATMGYPERGIAGDPYINCPAKNKMPKEVEPTYLELYSLYNKISECSLIEQHLGKNYLGCVWSEPKHPCSCNCPEQGVSFGDYLAYTRTYATFWDTPHYAPLYRNAQIGQLKSQVIQITISATKQTVKLGDLISIDHTNNMEGMEPSKMSGTWLVTNIQYNFEGSTIYKMNLTLMRDTTNGKYQTSKVGWASPIYLDKAEWGNE